MSDSNEKPRGSFQKISAFPSESSAVDPLSTDQDYGYKPLSILAIFGAVLGGLFVITMVVGFSAAFIFGTPWIMPPWIVVWPAASILLSFLAYTQIKASENTLGGEKLSLWAIRITALFILCYLANYAGTYFAVRNQAGTFAKQWLEIVAKGETDKAFLLTLKPPRPSEDSNLRTTFEITYNIASDPLSKGAYSSFKSKDFIRLVQSGSENTTKFVLKSSSSPIYEMGGYLVRLIYQVDIPDGTLEVALTALGVESPTGAFKGRQWQIILDGSGLQGKLKPNPESIKKFELSLSAIEFVSKWCMAVSNKIWDPAVFGVIPLDARQPLLNGAAPTLPLGLSLVGGALAQAAESNEHKLFLQACQILFDGKFVKVSDNFWSDPTMKPAILAAVSRAFNPLADHTPTQQISGNSEWLQVESGVIPRFKRTGNKVEFEFDCKLLLFPKYLVQASLIVESENTDDAKLALTQWHVRDIILQRGGSMPVPGPKPGR